MIVTITWQMVVAFITLGAAWTGFLLGAIKWLLNKQITGLEDRLADAENAAGEAKAGIAKHRELLTDSLAALRLEIGSKFVCGNHQRLEGNDEKMFSRLDKLHGEMRELVGGVKSLTGSMDMVQQHLINGGKK